MQSLCSSYHFNEQAITPEMIEFVLIPLQQILLLSGFKCIKSRKAQELKMKEWVLFFYLQANRHNVLQWRQIQQRIGIK
ncbi:hypothetical protein JOC58_004461 [Paenibacillus hunanensis]|uniref:Uncharacterized protein n=1 Tax=Paenibacillus hunanensis TaxID=539262 RepID=A0ABU1J4Y4_9BACL|nr:hypothetical protein [Paenibacillus hunanensis]